VKWDILSLKANQRLGYLAKVFHETMVKTNMSKKRLYLFRTKFLGGLTIESILTLSTLIPSLEITRSKIIPFSP